MQNKRGISAIVATVLIILITIAGVTILWTTILPLINQEIAFSDANARVDVVTSGGYTVYDKVNRIAIVQVKRGADESDMKYVRIIFNFIGTSYSSVVDAPAPNQAKSYKFNLSVGNYADPQSVQVAPIFLVGGTEREGTVTSSADIPIGALSTIPPSDELLVLNGDYRGASTRCSSVADCVPNQCQQSPVCNPDGSCSYSNKASGVTCDDGNAGTTNDVCNGAGGCAGTPISTATCSDGIQNQGETGIDCGGPCPACASCSDGIQNQGETGIDCGGPCPACAVYCTDVDNDNYCLQAQTSGCNNQDCTLGYSDCNDAAGNAGVWLTRTGPYYNDTDGEGVRGTTSFATICTGATIPSSYGTTAGTDCNDADRLAWINYPTLWTDTDRDSWGGSTIIGTNYCLNLTLPLGVANRTGDCLDSNAAVNPGATESSAATCSDTPLDNDCDGFVDCADTGCLTSCQGTPITGCGATYSTASTNYYLANSMSAGTSNCITVTADNVHINGNGYTISVSGSMYGVYLLGTSGNNVSNFELSNTKMTLSGSSRGVNMKYSDHFRIVGNNFTLAPSASGVYAIYAESDSYAMQGQILNNRLTDASTAYNYGLWIGPFNDRNTISFNNFSTTYGGIYVNSANNFVTDNTMTSSRYTGIDIDGWNGKGNSIERNRACSNTNYDLRIYFCGDNPYYGLGNYCNQAKTVGCGGECQYSC
jgi:hypothetical protein